MRPLMPSSPSITDWISSVAVPSPSAVLLRELLSPSIVVLNLLLSALICFWSRSTAAVDRL